MKFPGTVKLNDTDRVMSFLRHPGKVPRSRINYCFPLLGGIWTGRRGPPVNLGVWCLVQHWLPFPGHSGSLVYKLEKCFPDGNMILRLSSSDYNKKRRKLSVPSSASSLRGPNFLFTETYTQKDGSRAERYDQKCTHLQLEPDFLVSKFRWEFTAGPPYPGLGSFNNLLAFFINQRELRMLAPGTGNRHKFIQVFTTKV